eukprot:Gregarina_sp_Pseudo_9__1773@NODE_2204_length_1097_cov_33_402647_g2029_i0_p1_GENE_NODE_2204_length_1097_cov_33_402647_g2029_i0NODE_2204_length_1097_cov_33_402647_g2029_i0_p1_ORF_typecomplete_len344_score107_92SAP/PF02037_27/3_5e06SbsC_C/PF18058_1/0_00025SbsC_C/PF18058_1/2_1e03Retrotrans_gag/PF03732_17/0_16Retrotrans_gag/PF03732_17/1_3e03OSTHTH/PF12872_7/0_051_NODE_2204_length_1097_cov_33_402647_g2029_i0651069
MTISPAEDAHVKRSQLINEFLQESRALEKDLKKKKLPPKQKEQLEAKLDSLREEHTKRLAEFDDAQGTGKSSKHTDGTETETPLAAAETPSPDGEAPVFEERSWGSLSKRELEEECQRRGLSRKGGKEDLVSRLTIFTLDQKLKQAKATDPSAPPKVEAPKTIKYETVTATGPSSKQDYRNKNKKLWKRRGPPKGSAHRKMSSSESEGSGDETETAPEQLDEERQKQLKREQIIQNVIGSILKKYNKGIPVDEMPSYLEKFKVVNFAPSALGYQSVEEWISNQPKDVLHVDKKSLLVYPPRVGEMPSSSDDEEESGSSSDSDDSSSDESVSSSE